MFTPYCYKQLVVKCDYVLQQVQTLCFLIIDNFIKKLLKSYLLLIRLKKKKKLFIQKHYLQFLSI